MSELDPVFSAVARYFAVLSEPSRLKIMHALCAGERSVNRIAADTGITQSSVSRHLALMRQHALVGQRRDGKQVFYRIADETMLALCRAVCTRLTDAMQERHPLKRQFTKVIAAARRRAA